MAVRTLWQPAPFWQSGIAFSAKQLLEVAVMLLGASVSFAAIAAAGPLLIGLIVAVVVVMIALSFIISRALSLPVRMSIMASSRHAHATEVSRDIACRGRIANGIRLS